MLASLPDKLFGLFDGNSDGTISLDEWEKQFDVIDNGKTGAVSRKAWAILGGSTEFFDNILISTKNAKSKQHFVKEDWSKAFAVFDKNADGMLSKEEFEECHSISLDKEEADEKKDSDSEEESDEEDDVIDDEEFEARIVAPKARQSVSAEAYGEWNKKLAFKPPSYEKSQAQSDRLRATLGKSFMFQSLDQAEFNIIVGAMQEVQVETGKQLITKGEDGDTLFVIETGVFDCSIPIDGVETVVKTCREGDVFGELALLYNAPRAATVTAKETSTTWSLDRATFNNIVKEAAQNKRNRYDAFLGKVNLLSNMDPYERSQLADALKVESFGEGQTIMHQGEMGDKFYIVEEGAAIAKKDGAQVMEYGVGDYFGELALIRNAPRAATVLTKAPAKLLSINSVTFKRLLNIDEIKKRADELYK